MLLITMVWMLDMLVLLMPSSWNERLNQYQEEKNKVQSQNKSVDKSQNKSILQQMREMSGKTVSIDEMNRSAGHEKEMNRSR